MATQEDQLHKLSLEELKAKHQQILEILRHNEEELRRIATQFESAKFKEQEAWQLRIKLEQLMAEKQKPGTS